MTVENESSNLKPFALKLIAILMLLTFFRAQTLFFIPTLEMYGGVSPNGWFGPWVSDFIIGLFVPLIVFLALKRRGYWVWGLLIFYNAVGAFDYTQGLTTQWIDPLPASVASSFQVYAGIGVFLVFQLLSLFLLFRKDVYSYFCLNEKT